MGDFGVLVDRFMCVLLEALWEEGGVYPHNPFASRTRHNVRKEMVK